VSLDLQGALVLITGASTGIGRAAAREFVRKGSRVIGAARNGEALDSLAAELGGERCFLPVVTDVGEPGSVDAMVARVIGETGLPDVVIANAGIGLDARFDRTPEKALRKLFEVNFFGAVRSVQPFVAPMVDRGSGRILFISSILGKRGIPHYSAYTASKFALHGLADCMRGELYGSGVTVGLVCPTTTESEFHGRIMREGPRQQDRRVRRQSAEHVARVIVKMARSKRIEVVLSPEGKFVTWLDALAPGLVDWITAKVLSNK
jgi:NAD(P)-dependent dehydrogenase (short-subunit alcohol dehydrogenase family)